MVKRNPLCIVTSITRHIRSSVANKIKTILYDLTIMRDFFFFRNEEF